MQRILDTFNHAQYKVITAPLGHLAVNAAAGTGKTNTLAARTLYIQNEYEIPPTAILAISFSRTARARLIDKLTKLCRQVGNGSPVPTYTFHGLAFRIVRMAIGVNETWLKPKFDLIESSTSHFSLKHQASLMQGVAPGIDQENAFMAFMKAIDELRQGSAELEPYLSPDQLNTDVAFEVDIGQNMQVTINGREVIQVWRRYERLMRQYNKIDYTGLIVEAIKVLAHPSGHTRERVQNGLQAILVDEYQDTSRAQEKLLFSLASKNIPITVVGDTDQTIYTFNGSSVTNMENFTSLALETNVPVLPTVQLVENYRSTARILSTANRIRNHSTEKPQLIPAKDIGDDKLISYREYNFPVRLVLSPRLELAADYIAKEIVRLVKEECVDESEIAVLVRKNSEFSPQSEMVKEFLVKLDLQVEHFSEAHNKNRDRQLQFVYDFCQEPDNYSRSLIEVINEKPRLMFPAGMDVEIFITLLQEAIDSGATYCYEAIDLLFYNMNFDEASGDTTSKHIQIRTIHSAKGEEYRVVFLLYLGDRSFPHGSRPDIDEERRLLYVGITRAQERLYILGKPGIHHEDFFGNCKGPETVYEEHMVPGGENNQTSTLSESDFAFKEIVDAARDSQKLFEEEERKRLWKMFEDDY